MSYLTLGLDIAVLDASVQAHTHPRKVTDDFESGIEMFKTSVLTEQGQRRWHR
jgi:hypothetical protein